MFAFDAIFSPCKREIVMSQLSFLPCLENSIYYLFLWFLYLHPRVRHLLAALARAACRKILGRFWKEDLGGFH